MAKKKVAKPAVAKRKQRTSISICTAPPLPFIEQQMMDAHSRLAQALVAFGAGAGPIRIKAAAAAYFYERLWKGFYCQAARPDNYLAWFHVSACQSLLPEIRVKYHGDAAQILDLCRSVGRFAASLATNDGRFAIGKEDVEAAINEFRQPQPRAGHWRLLGAYCVD